jgi:hypothetical protein
MLPGPVSLDTEAGQLSVKFSVSLRDARDTGNSAGNASGGTLRRFSSDRVYVGDA